MGSNTSTTSTTQTSSSQLSGGGTSSRHHSSSSSRKHKSQNFDSDSPLLDNANTDKQELSYSSLHSFPPTRRREKINQLLENSTNNAKSCPLLPAVGTRVSTASSSKRSSQHPLYPHHTNTNNNMIMGSLSNNDEYCSTHLPNLNSSSPTSSNINNLNSSPNNNNNINSIINNTVGDERSSPTFFSNNNSTISTYPSSPSTITTYGSPTISTPNHKYPPHLAQNHQHNHLSTPPEDSLLNHPITPKTRSPTLYNNTSPLQSIISNSNNSKIMTPYTPSVSPNSPNLSNDDPLTTTSVKSSTSSPNTTNSKSTPSSVSNSPRGKVGSGLLKVEELVNPLQDLIQGPRLSQSKSLGILEEYLPITNNSKSNNIMGMTISPGATLGAQLHANNSASQNGSNSRRNKKNSTPTLKEIQDMCFCSENLYQQLDVEEKRKVTTRKRTDSLQDSIPRIGTTAYKTREPRYGDSLVTPFSQTNGTNSRRNRHTKGPDYDQLRCETASPKGLDAILMNSSRTLTNYGNDDVAIYVTTPTSAPEINTPSKSIAKEKKKRVLMIHQKHTERRNARRSHSVIGIVHH